MLVVNKMFINMVKQITREMMMIMLVIAPVLAGTFFRIGIPILEKYVLSRYGLESVLVSYYEMFSWLLAMLIGMLFAFVGGLVILGEIDDNITKYIMITPAGMKGYLWSRIMIPAILSGIAALVCYFAHCRRWHSRSVWNVSLLERGCLLVVRFCQRDMRNEWQRMRYSPLPFERVSVKGCTPALLGIG